MPSTSDGSVERRCPSANGEWLLRNGRADLVPFTVDVHAAQWGTLSRLVHALIATDHAEGWAIDENTALEVSDGMVTVHGPGAATRVRRQDGDITVAVHVAGDQVPLSG